MGLAIPKPSPIKLQVLLFLFFLLSHHLSGMLGIISTYLSVTDKSGWERDWANFRKERHFAYTKAQAIVFIALGFMATLLPFILWAVFPFTLEPKAGTLLVVVSGILYLLFVTGMA